MAVVKQNGAELPLDVGIVEITPPLNTNYGMEFGNVVSVFEILFTTRILNQDPDTVSHHNVLVIHTIAHDDYAQSLEFASYTPGEYGIPYREFTEGFSTDNGLPFSWPSDLDWKFTWATVTIGDGTTQEYEHVSQPDFRQALVDYLVTLGTVEF